MGAGNDYADTNNCNDTVSGESDADQIHGGDGWDSLFGNTGADTIFGGPARDGLSGGYGGDTLNDRGFTGDMDTDFLYGEEDNDTLDACDLDLSDTIEGGPGTSDICDRNQGEGVTTCEGGSTCQPAAALSYRAEGSLFSSLGFGIASTKTEVYRQ
jgi:hypothetical protein